jgi:hypothetical protein
MNTAVAANEDRGMCLVMANEHIRICSVVSIKYRGMCSVTPNKFKEVWQMNRKKVYLENSEGINMFSGFL